MDPSASRISQTYRQQASGLSSMPQNPLPSNAGMGGQNPRYGVQNTAPNPTFSRQPDPHAPFPTRTLQQAQQAQQAKQASHTIHWHPPNTGPMPPTPAARFDAITQVADALRDTSHALDAHQHPHAFSHFRAAGAITTLYNNDEILIAATHIVNRALRLHTHGSTNLFFKDPANQPRGADAGLQCQTRIGHFIALVRAFKNAANDVMCGRFVHEFLASPIESWNALNGALAEWNRARMGVVPPQQVQRPVEPPVGASDEVPIDLTGDEVEAEDSWEGKMISF